MNELGLTVDIHNDHTIKTLDATSGVIKTIRQVGGKIIWGPILVGNTVSVSVETPTGKKHKLYKLPGLIIFRTNPA
tara:strand:- start:2359 stop:2586 length:228 start_codon:yes stop_codon:yes gene_type:complete